MTADEEAQRIDLDKELSLARRELTVMRSELEAAKASPEERKARRRRDLIIRLVTIVASIIAALVAAGGAIAGRLLQDRDELNLERRKFEFTLLRDALGPADTVTRKRNLDFIVGAGLVQDDRLAKFLREHPTETFGLAPRDTASAGGGEWAVVLRASRNREELV